MRPAREAKVATARIDDLSHEGRGVAHHEGKTVFIDDALPGELIEWTLRKRGRNFDEGVIARILEASLDRVTPRCAHFGSCGGCALQHLSAQRQIEFKQRQLMEALTRIGHVAPAEVLPALLAEPWNYRRRARLSARWVAKKNRVVVGFRERSAPLVADLQHCDVLTPPADNLLRPLSELLTGLSIRDRVPQIEVAVAEKGAIALLIRILLPLTTADRTLLEQFERDQQVQIYLQPGGNDTVVPLQGAAVPLTYRLPQFDVELHFEPADFVQINAAVNELMVARAVELLQPSSDDDVLDLFCGLGNFSLPLARRSRHVVGIEGETGLVARARRNAQRNGITNAEFFTANLAAEDVGQAAWATRRYTRVLLDPPRAGARETLPLIAKSGASRVVYISCHPGTLARDAGILVNEHGFELTAAGAMDMFPHTTHVESIAVFDR